MALLTSVREIPQRTERIRYPAVDLRALSMSSSSSEIVEERSSSTSSSTTSPNFAPPSRALTDSDDAVYVALGKEVKEAELTLSWALHNCGGRKTIILHVHQPAQKISMMGANVPISRLEEYRVRAHHEAERQDMQKLLDKYMLICKKAGVQVDKLYIEKDSIEKGIVELILLHCIKKLVMGGAAKGHYSRKMMEPRSKKAIYVRQQAPSFCQIRFICKGHLIHTREGTPSGVNMEGMSPLLQPCPSGDNLEVMSRSFQASPSDETGQSHSLRSRSVPQGENGQLLSSLSVPDHRRVVSDNHAVKFTGVSTRDGLGGVSPHSRSSVQQSSDGWDRRPQRSHSMASRFSSSSSSEIIEDLASLSIPRMVGSGNELDAPLHSDEDYCSLSPSPLVTEGNMHDELYNRLQQSVEDAEISRREAYEESMKHRKAVKEAIEAARWARASEARYSEEFRLRKEVEEALVKHKEEIENMQYQLDEIKNKLQVAMEQKSSLESQIATSDKTVEDLKQKMFAAIDLLQKFKIEKDNLQVERDNAVREAEELKIKQAEEASSASMSCFFSEYSICEINEATHNFDQELKIGEGGYGSVYKGHLHHTQVAIKVLHQHSSQGPLEFQQEVGILSTLRHPNIVTLIGACRETCSLIYEYLPNGSLEDRLSCKDNTPPLSWQTRIRIASELCSALIFLHSCSPRGIIHGDLKPANILLDNNFVSKLCDFGMCRVLGEDKFSDNNTSLCCRTDHPKGTLAYIDPEYLATGELTTKSDVYSFGIILLRLLTGKPALGIYKEVENALNKGNLKDILDSTAGDWPFVQAQQLVHLAMRSCEMSRKTRPELASEIWRVLEPMRASCGTCCSRLIFEEESQMPSYFICPIFQEVMQDPVVAADGYTYEAEALKGWLDSDHDTSPMTNLKLAHRNLVQNHALRSAIQEWLQKR
nr:U-box domain-containing protein 33-like isoform X2 [Coffea arabica]